MEIMVKILNTFPVRGGKHIFHNNWHLANNETRLYSRNTIVAPRGAGNNIKSNFTSSPSSWGAEQPGCLAELRPVQW
jgi:hypothetical protein